MAITNNKVFEFIKQPVALPTIGGCSKGFVSTPAVPSHTTVSMTELKIPGGVCGYPFIDTDLYWVDTFSDTIEHITLQYNGELIASGGSSTAYPILVALKQDGSVDWKTGYLSPTVATGNFTNTAIDISGNIFIGFWNTNLTSLLKLQSNSTYTWNKGKAIRYSYIDNLPTSEEIKSSTIGPPIITTTSAGTIVVARENQYTDSKIDYTIPNPDFPAYPGTETTNDFIYSILVDFYNTNGTLLTTVLFKLRNPDTGSNYSLAFPTPTPLPTYSETPTSWTNYNVVDLCNDIFGNCFLSSNKYDYNSSTSISSNWATNITKMTSTGSITWNITIPKLQVGNTFTDRYGDFYIAGNTLDSSGNITNGTIIKLNKSTGAILWQRVFAVDSTHTDCFASIDCSLNIYAERRDASNNSIFFKMTQTGSVLWARVLTIT